MLPPSCVPGLAASRTQTPKVYGPAGAEVFQPQLAVADQPRTTYQAVPLKYQNSYSGLAWVQPEAVAVTVTCVRLLFAAVGGAALTLTDVHDDDARQNEVDACVSTR